MKGAAFLADLRCRGVQLRPEANGLRYRAPKGVLTDVDRAALREHRDALLMLLRSEAGASSPPLDPCLNCNMGAWFWQPNWPVPGAGRWLCRTCSARPSSTAAEVAARPTADECAQLEAEAAAGGVARVVVDVLAGADATIPPGLAICDVKRELDGRLVPDTAERLTPARDGFPAQRKGDRRS